VPARRQDGELELEVLARERVGAQGAGKTTRWRAGLEVPARQRVGAQVACKTMR
jgi:hypothetical protein